MKKIPKNKRQMKKLEKQYKSGQLLKMKNKKVADRLMSLAIGLFGED